MTTPLNKLTIIALWAAGLLLSAVSILYTVQLWSSIPHDETGKWLAASAAVALEICKFLFIPLGLYLLKNRYYSSGSILMLVGLILLIVSIGASIGFLEQSTEKAEQELLSQSVDYMTVKSKLNSLNDQINTLNESAKIDLKNNYRTRANQTLSKIADLETQREIWLAKLKQINLVVKTSAGALFGSVAKTFDGNEKTIQSWAYILLAILIDICSITVFSVLGIKSKPVQEKQIATGSSLDDIQLIKFKKAIKALERGQKLHLREVSNLCGLRYKQLIRDTSELESTGLIVRQGKHLVAI